MEAEVPSLRRTDGAAHLLPAVAMTIEVAVLELDSSAVSAVGGEAHLDLTRARRIRFELPLQVDVPADDEARRWVEREHTRPPALAAVDATVVHVTADTRFEHHLGELGLQDVMLGRPPAPDAVREDRERPLDRRIDDDRRPDRRVSRLRAHCSSRVPCSTACLKPARARSQNRSR